MFVTIWVKLNSISKVSGDGCVLECKGTLVVMLQAMYVKCLSH